MMRGLIVSLLFVFILSKVEAQQDSLKFKVFLRSAIVPASMMGYGLWIMGDRGWYSSEALHSDFQQQFPNFQTKVDDYLQYVPMLSVYAMDGLGYKAKNSFGKRTWLLLQAELLTMGGVYMMKRISAIERPDGSDNYSFPSGHTAQAFLGAAFLAKEYGHKSKWLSVGGYTVATSVGILAMMNERHWASDVWFGAGYAILSTQLVYWLSPYTTIRF
jgi:hypothetical protein